MTKLFKKFTESEKKEWMEKKEKEKEDIFKSISDGIKEFRDSDRYKRYLDFLSKFHNYSFGNVMLIESQRPGAKRVASFKKWQELGRSVNKGETAIKVLAPCRAKRTIEVQKEDSLTGKPVYDGEGNPVMEKQEQHTMKGFKAVPVFDISQTNGKEIPKLITELRIDRDIYTLIKAVEGVSKCPVKIEPTMTFTLDSGVKGYFNIVSEEIFIRPGMPNLQTLKTLVHEMAHSEIHSKHSERDKTTREQREIEAESVAYVTCKRLGLDTSDYSFGYIASWAKLDEKNVKGSLDIIQKTSSDFIERIEEKHRDILDEKKKSSSISRAKRQEFEMEM